MKKQLKDTQILLEILILTAAVAIIAAAVYFFETNVGQSLFAHVVLLITLQDNVKFIVA